MRIAFTHKLQLTTSEDEAEFDPPKTIEALTAALGRLGHDVEVVEVSGPASRTVARLEALSPDIIFNTAEGRSGRYREAFYPGLFEQLGIPYTASGAHCCFLTLDKRLTKLHLAAQGVPTPKWAFLDELAQLETVVAAAGLAFPMFVKPNFEGSSKGIHADSVVEDTDALRLRVAATLAQYPMGVLVEEYVPGRDVSVAFLEKRRDGSAVGGGGLLPPVEYVLDESVRAARKYPVYDFELKHRARHLVRVETPKDLPADVRGLLAQHARTCVKTLALRDLGILDFRVSPDGSVTFLEANALPLLAPGAAFHIAAAAAGLDLLEDVLGGVLRSAAERQGVPLRAGNGAARRKAPSLRIGFTYNVKRIVPKAEGDDDTQAEYDSPKTISAIRDAIASYGHEVVDLEATPELPALLAASNVDVVFNIAEGIKGRNRESQVPALCELLDIPYSGSDPAALSLALDKALAKRIVRTAGVATPEWVLMTTGKERLPKGMSFPVIVKPVAEGSSKGVLGTSVAEDEAQLRELAREIIGRYRQGALVEEYLCGREFTVALLGERRPRVLPPMEIVFLDPSKKNPVYAFEHKLDWSKDIRYDVPAQVDGPLLRELERAARGAFMALGCRDVARVDLRLDARGRVNFIECNPLPGLTPDWSDLCMIAKAAGMDYRTLMGEILAPAIKRFREKRRGEKPQAAQAVAQANANGNGNGNGHAHVTPVSTPVVDPAQLALPQMEPSSQG